MKIGLSNSIFKGESLKFILKVSTYLQMDWVEIKTELLKEDMKEAIELIKSNPEYSKIKNFSVHAAHKKMNLVDMTNEQIDRHKMDLDFAKAIGSDRVILHAGYYQGKKTKEELEKIIPIIEEYLDYVKGTNVHILLENTMVDRPKVCSDPKELKYILKRIISSVTN